MATKRRNMLKLIGGFATIPFASLTIEEVEAREGPDSPDVGVINNSLKKKSVHVKIYQKDRRGRPLFERSFNLAGHPGSKTDSDDHMFRGDVRVESPRERGDGNQKPRSFVVEARIPAGASDATSLYVSPKGLPDEQTVSVYATRQEDVEVSVAY